MFRAWSSLRVITIILLAIGMLYSTIIAMLDISLAMCGASHVHHHHLLPSHITYHSMFHTQVFWHSVITTHTYVVWWCMCSNGMVCGGSFCRLPIAWWTCLAWSSLIFAGRTTESVMSLNIVVYCVCVACVSCFYASRVWFNTLKQCLAHQSIKCDLFFLHFQFFTIFVVVMIMVGWVWMVSRRVMTCCSSHSAWSI
jgi:hypothetical protein